MWAALTAEHWPCTWGQANPMHLISSGDGWDHNSSTMLWQQQRPHRGEVWWRYTDTTSIVRVQVSWLNYVAQNASLRLRLGFEKDSTDPLLRVHTRTSPDNVGLYSCLYVYLCNTWPHAAMRLFLPVCRFNISRLHVVLVSSPGLSLWDPFLAEKKKKSRSLLQVSQPLQPCKLQPTTAAITRAAVPLRLASLLGTCL